MNINRVINTSFWEKAEVLDNYSIEDKFFILYLSTNPKSTQLGIYHLPLKRISFETGFTIEVVRVLLDRFENEYNEVIYNYDTQEISLLNSLKTSIIRGGTPVTDLLKKEINYIKDTQLIVKTYNHLKAYWQQSARAYDETVQNIFIAELHNRGVTIDCHKMESPSVPPINDNRIKESLNINQTTGILVDTNEDPIQFYTKTIGSMSTSEKLSLNQWQLIFKPDIINEAIKRSIHKEDPFKYIHGILNNWKRFDVKNIQDIKQIDLKYLKDKAN